MIKGFYNDSEDYDFLNNLTIKNTKINAFKYLHGDCHEFSIALNKLFGYPIVLWTEFDENIEENVLIHAFNIIKQDSNIYFVDIRDITDDINILTNGFDYCDDIIITELSLLDSLHTLKEMNIPINNLSDCLNIINSYKNYYTLWYLKSTSGVKLTKLLIGDNDNPSNYYNLQ